MNSHWNILNEFLKGAKKARTLTELPLLYEFIHDPKDAGVESTLARDEDQELKGVPEEALAHLVERPRLVALVTEKLVHGKHKAP